MTRRYWVIAPYDSRNQKVYDKVWEYDLQNGTIAIGWRKMGDFSKLNREELEAKYIETYGKRYIQEINLIWNYYHEISIGDVIIARHGRKKYDSIGTVTGKAYYDFEEGKKRVSNLTDKSYSNFLKVEWDGKPFEFEKMVFGFNTMYEISEEKFKSLVGDITEDEEQVTEQSQEFALEKYLEDFIVTNFDAIFKGKLELYRDPDGVIGQQYPTGVVGRIDILAVEPKTKNFVVIELKKGRKSDVVVGQILRYMGWIKEELCEENQDVKGLIICRDEDEKLKYALKPVQSFIDVRFYKVDFHLVD